MFTVIVTIFKYDNNIVVIRLTTVDSTKASIKEHKTLSQRISWCSNDNNNIKSNNCLV